VITDEMLAESGESGGSEDLDLDALIVGPFEDPAPEQQQQQQQQRRDGGELPC
jgi:hypothetical protein